MTTIRLLLLALLLEGCQADLPIEHDPALLYLLKEQSGDYAGIARWAHQYMPIIRAAYLLSNQGYRCRELKTDTSGRLPADYECLENKSGLLPGIATIYLGANKQTGFLQKVEAKRSFETFGRLLRLDKRFGAPILASGIHYKTIDSFADFAVDTLTVSHFNPCADIEGYDPMFNSREILKCKQWLEARQSGWPRWNGAAVDADQVPTALERLKNKGFDCPKYPTGRAFAAVPVYLEGDIAWLECRIESFDRQTQKILLGLRAEDSALIKIRVQLNNEQADIPVKIIPPEQYPGERQVLVKTLNNEIKQIKLALGESYIHYRGEVIPPVDSKSRQRLLQASAWQAGIVSESYRKQSSVPNMLKLDLAAFLFARLGPEVMRDWRSTLIDIDEDTIAAIVIAECLQENQEQTTRCLFFHFAGNPKLLTTYSEAVREISDVYSQLPDRHPVRRRIERLSNAITAYRELLKLPSRS
ncbi:MAG: hypothetical protein ACU84J_12490 [Gammaproteobacteria bacterium]